MNFYENINFDRTVFIVNDDFEIEGHVYRDLCEEYAEETTTPRGVGKTFHLRDNELWTWGYMGNAPRKVESFDSEAEAEHALYVTFAYDLSNSALAPIIHDTRAEAEADAAEMKSEQEEF